MKSMDKSWNLFIVDHETFSVKRTMRRLRRLKSTIDVSYKSEYWQDGGYCQFAIITTKSEDELDDWLWRTNMDYVGVVSVQTA